MLTKAIADKKQAATNVALCSVHLMGIYENLTSVQRKGTFLAHNQGANAMLQLRTVEEFYSDIISARLYEVIYAHLAARRPQIPTRDVVKVDELLPSLYKNSNAFVIRLIWRAAMLHARWHETKQSPNPPTNRMALQELLQSALELESDYEAWEANVTPAWNYHMTPNTPEARSTYDAKLQKLFLGCPGAPEEIHIYPSLKRVWIWGFYRTSRILVLRDLLEMLNWMLRFRDPCLSFRPQEAAGQSMPTALSNANLRMHHSIATARLVEVIEKNCSSILGSFTVPIDTKSATDICGMRGYICIWPLGTMDSVLSSGLVPDSNAGKHPHSATHLPTPPPVHSQPHLATSTSNASSSSEPSTALESYEAAPPFSELRNIRSKSESDQSPGASPPSNTPVLDQNAKKNHIFDPNPAHPYDHPLDLPPLDHGVEPRRIDIAARREWINRLMYYMATELGLKKALWCPVMQGYMPTVKPMVDEILSQHRGF
ncbi:uncharacterized protein J4E87_003370 [Alternaria ethzedia]|uniref:uncharacterized protein n=1 Tax=Alternaria ethzedia TaxID=181014 RepID=UPI0020C589C6|nr:uncharacterized protein J4E87_003370 [Alternaria ethzedia]KAI4629109.1 hypothetical protein J4E87_003370 [Alternaria ethzedia]